MTRQEGLSHFIRFVFVLCAIVLIALTTPAIKAQWNSIIYVLNAAFLLLGGRWIGDWVADRVLPMLDKPSDEN